MHAKEGTAELNAVLETNSLLVLLGHPHTGDWSTILPDSLAALLMDRAMLVVLPLIEPEASYEVGLVATDQEPPAMARAFLDMAELPTTTRTLKRLLQKPSRLRVTVYPKSKTPIT